MRTEQEIQATALDALGYLAACERGDADSVDAFLATIHTSGELWHLVSALSGHCVGMLRLAASLTGQCPGKMLAALATDIRENR
jgi:hypothetical protein